MVELKTHANLSKEERQEVLGIIFYANSRLSEDANNLYNNFLDLSKNLFNNPKISQFTRNLYKKVYKEIYSLKLLFENVENKNPENPYGNKDYKEYRRIIKR